MSQKQIDGKNNMPVAMRVFSLVMGILLVGDGMRRFAVPRETRDLYAFIMYILVGAVFFLIFGYSRRLYLNDEGLFRRVNVWGRKTKQPLITWDEIEDVKYTEQKNEFTACFESGNKGYRMAVDIKDKDSLCELIQEYYFKRDEYTLTSQQSE